MTVVLGMECQNGIVMAADKQVAENVREAPAWVKRTSRHKLRAIPSLQSFQILMGASGPNALTEKVLNQCEISLGSIRECPSLEDIEKVCEGSMTQVQQRWAHIARSDTLSLLVGIYNNTTNEKRIVAVYDQGIADRMDGFGCIGDGKFYAQYILSKLWAEAMDTGVAALLAVYCVAEVSTISPAVGSESTVQVIGEGTIPEIQLLQHRYEIIKNYEQSSLKTIFGKVGKDKPDKYHAQVTATHPEQSNSADSVPPSNM